MAIRNRRVVHEHRRKLSFLGYGTTGCQPDCLYLPAVLRKDKTRESRGSFSLSQFTAMSWLGWVSLWWLPHGKGLILVSVEQIQGTTFQPWRPECYVALMYQRVNKWELGESQFWTVDIHPGAASLGLASSCNSAVGGECDPAPMSREEESCPHSSSDVSSKSRGEILRHLLPINT